jgi:hypothetical protein
MTRAFCSSVAPRASVGGKILESASFLLRHLWQTAISVAAPNGSALTGVE